MYNRLQILLLEGLSGATRALLKHRRTSRYHYKDKKNPESRKQSIKSWYKGEDVYPFVPKSEKRNLQRKYDSDYQITRLLKFGKVYPDFRERLFGEGKSTGSDPMLTGYKVGRANITDYRIRKGKIKLKKDRIDRALKIRSKVVKRFTKKHANAKQHAGDSFDKGFNKGSEKRRNMMRNS